ncbi:hypothetical protein KY360_06935 [Candidatus Woesearchaeota archaeon]|nr:hypothetical protein [Candidatus Woesearchaeota archaeon]
MAKKLFLLLFLLMLVDTVSAAVIHGSVYDLSLDKISDVRLEIDTEPKQQYISKDGDYEFNVPVGTYTIKASYYNGGLVEASAEETVSVKDEGTYVLDLVLFPSFDEETKLIDESDEIRPDEYFEDGKPVAAYVLVGVLVLVALAAVIYLLKRKKPKRKEEKAEKEPADLDKIVKILKQEGGRATQKEIRKHFPLSEAKMSLMIAELEHKGVVKKIKKGRGNIIILEK